MTVCATVHARMCLCIGVFHACYYAKAALFVIMLINMQRFLTDFTFFIFINCSIFNVFGRM